MALSLGKNAKFFGVALFLSVASGCGGLTTEPSAAAGSSHLAMRHRTASSWMSPAAKSDDLLYVSDAIADVYVYSYPEGKLVGTLSGFKSAGAECVDPRGNVWITDFESQKVVKYAHGGTAPIASVSDSNAPFGCSVDPTTGNLAVADAKYPGDLAIFAGASGSPLTYTDADFPGYYYCSYDSAGNLFADDADTKGIIAELPAAGNDLETITLNENLITSSMQWDGAELAIVGNLPPSGPDNHTRGPLRVYRVQVSGSSGSIIGETPLKSQGGNKVNQDVQFWISGNTIIGPDRYRDVRQMPVLSWRYPKGGFPTRVIRPTYGEPWGTALSRARGHGSTSSP